MKMKKTGMFFIAAAFVFQALASCDMEFIRPLEPPAAAAGGTSGAGPGAAGTDPGSGGWPGGPGLSSGGEQAAALAEEQEKNAQAIAEMEKNGHYLLVYNLPATAEAEHVSGVRVTDGAKQAARADENSRVLIDSSGVTYRHAYIPLAAPGGGPFTRTGSFYVEFSVRIDALARILVTAGHMALVSFSDGKGSIDIDKLFKQDPSILAPVENPDPAAAAEAAAEAARTEEQINAIVGSGSYIRFYSLPCNISKSKFSAVSVLSAAAAVARPSDYEAIAVRADGLAAEAFVPLAEARGNANAVFRETGSYFVYFSITVDALKQLSAGADNPLLSVFTDGNTHIDAANIPPVPLPPPLKPHHLTVTGLPLSASPSNFTGVYILNSEGVVAKCADYTKIAVTAYNGRAAALIPLAYDNSQSFNGQDFSDSGYFIVTFSFFSDALENIVAAERNNCVASFTAGCAALDAGSIPPVPHRYLTVTNLPPNIQELDVSDVFVWNQAGKIAKCENYALLLIENGGSSSTLKIPLVYQNGAARLFEETGGYYVTFDLNIDALTRIVINEKEKVLVSFAGGSGSLDAEKLPQALPVPYLTITGLPSNTAKNNFSDVFLYNAAGKIARCANYLDILISKGGSAASAMIPLVYDANPSEYFRDSGEFIAAFTVNADVNTQIIKTRADALPARFTDGSGHIDLASDYGFFSGGLVNPGDGAPPVVKKGTAFEINGSYALIKNDTPVKPVSLSHTSAVYVYAVQKTGAVEFEYSTAVPSYDQAKKGWYSGGARALYRLVYLKDSVDRYFAKTFINDSWRHFETFPVDSAGIASTMDRPAWYYLPGSGNPPPASVTLDAGAYVFVLSGAGGGGGGGIDGAGNDNYWGGPGGAGGFAAELVTLASPASATVFAGQGGGGAGAVSFGFNQSTGTGGGGSGTFVFSENNRYLLCAGGGAGGLGFGPGPAASFGGAGGSIGSGGGGSSGDGWASGYAPSNGGQGGGYLGGAAGLYTAAYKKGPGGHTGYFLPFANKLGFSTDSGMAVYAEYGGPDAWKNTNGANGGTAGVLHGGNNRSAARGNGAAGGAGGAPSDSILSAGGPGGDGYILVYKIF
jgi:hypothetical protein